MTTEPSALSIILDELRQVRNDVRIDIGAVRADLASIHKRTEEAHQRIDRYENRFWGWICGIGGLGAAGGMTFGEGAKQALKTIFMNQ